MRLVMVKLCKLVGEPEKGGILRVRSQKGQNSELLAKFNAGLKRVEIQW